LEERLEYFGDQLGRINNESTLRIGFININGLLSRTEHPKNKQLYNSIETKQISILGLVELNKCWHLLPDKDRWKDGTRGWWESSHSSLGYNRKEMTFFTCTCTYSKSTQDRIL
jgi:hypothetical protein